MKALTGSTKFKRSVAAGSCSKVVEISTKLTDLAVRFPTSPDIPGYSLQITAVSSLTCTDAQKASLKEIDKKFQIASIEISAALAAVQEELKLWSPPLVSFNNN